MPQRPNVLLITADDMNWDAVGAFGCPVAGTTPNIDRIATEGMRFNHAHVTISVCQPSRNTLLTGRYPHRHRGEGFYHLRQPGIPTLPQELRSAGYRVGILGKVSHSTPYADFKWDTTFGELDMGHGRNPAIYRQRALEFVRGAVQDQQPFFLMANSHDPHRPFYGNDIPYWYQPHQTPVAVPPSRVFKPQEITTPGFLADLPDVRLEIAEYYSSVRRCDDTVGCLLDVLRETGTDQNTLILYLSDNGMAFPFAKTNCYLNSTRTPWIMRWPGHLKPDSVERDHMISGIDLMPTVLDALGLPLPPGMDGRSFLPLLRGEKQAGRDLVFTQFYQTSARRNYPIRCVQSRQFGYLFNPWSNGTRVFKNESQDGRTMAAMDQAAASDPQLAQRVQLFRYRVPEEFYDFGNDPNALHNLINDPAYAGELNNMQATLERWMHDTQDPALEVFRHRQSPQACEDFMRHTADLIGGTS
ncbi:MAG: sulfatase [Phycisphaeraceae bacterium]|nr:sulfatase [Phycisphaeraceae bacterium]